MQLENLAKAGAFDTLDPNRARLFAGVETVLRRAQAVFDEKTSGQIGLFGGGGKPEPLRLPDHARLAACWTAWRSRRRRWVST